MFRSVSSAVRIQPQLGLLGLLLLSASGCIRAGFAVADGAPSDTPSSSDASDQRSDAIAAPPAPIAVLAAAERASCALDAEQLPWCWGIYGDPELSVVGRVSDLRRYQMVSVAGGSAGGHGCAIAEAGTLWCWGADLDQKLGLGPGADSTPTPRQVGQHRWRRIATARAHSCGIQHDGTLWCWGWGGNGRLGQGGDLQTASAPIQLGARTDWSEVSARSGHTCALTTTQEVYCWGRNVYGEVGAEGTGDTATPGTVGTPKAIAGRWRTVSAGGTFSCAVRDDRTLWCWGDNASGQLGRSVEVIPRSPQPLQVGQTSSWDRVAVGAAHACAIDLSKNLHCWGEAAAGQVGIDGVGAQPALVRVGTQAGWSEVVAGTVHSCGVRAGVLYCWGDNSHEQLGAGCNASTSQPCPPSTPEVYQLP